MNVVPYWICEKPESWSSNLPAHTGSIYYFLLWFLERLFLHLEKAWAKIMRNFLYQLLIISLVLQVWSIMLVCSISLSFVFQVVIVTQLLRSTSNVTTRLPIFFQVLMGTMSLRRTKEKGLVCLPSKSIETFFVNLSVEEREVYDQMEGEAKNIVQEYILDDSVMRNYYTVLSILLRLRQICTDMALCPSDLKALLPPSKIEGNCSIFVLSMLHALIISWIIGTETDAFHCLCPLLFLP